jgi:hypothetical protein
VFVIAQNWLGQQFATLSIPLGIAFIAFALVFRRGILGLAAGMAASDRRPAHA